VAVNRVDERDRGLKRFFKRLRVFDGLEVVVGIPAAEGAENRDGTTLAGIAAAHEFGGPGNRPPQRSFLRDTFDIHAKKYGDLMEKATQRVLKNESPKKALFILGETARADVIDRINQGILPELSQVTIDRKGSDLPLVDTGQLRASIRSLVRKETNE
jgi:hypothetical protein